MAYDNRDLVDKISYLRSERVQDVRDEYSVTHIFITVKTIVSYTKLIMKS